ncbi:MAG: MurR/RpiR family transcriptional regulator [Synergistales bacterium]
MTEPIFSKASRNCAKLPPKQRLVCRFIMENSTRIPFLTVEELAAAAGASPATVVRVVNGMGFEKYQDLKDEVTQMLIAMKPATRTEFEDAWEDSSGEDMLLRVAHVNIENIKGILTPELVRNFKRSIDILTAAKRIRILALRSSRSAALYLGLLLREFTPNVSVVPSLGSDEMYEDLLDYTPEDAVFAFSYGARFYARRTVDAVRFIKARGIPVILLTDEIENPAVGWADCVLHVPHTRHHFSLAAVITVLDSIIAEIGRRNPDQSKKKLRLLWDTLASGDITVPMGDGVRP